MSPKQIQYLGLRRYIYLFDPPHTLTHSIIIILEFGFTIYSHGMAVLMAYNFASNVISLLILCL